MGLVHYISENLFPKTKKNLSYDENFLVVTISKIRNSYKHLIEHKPQTLKKLDSTLKLKSPLLKSTRSILSQTPNLIRKLENNSQIQKRATA